jgi:hypothetical protein
MSRYSRGNTKAGYTSTGQRSRVPEFGLIYYHARLYELPIKDWAFEDHRVTIYSNQDLSLDENLIGEKGSPTKVSKLIQAPKKIWRGIFLNGSTCENTTQLTKILKREY